MKKPSAGEVLQAQHMLQASLVAPSGGTGTELDQIHLPHLSPPSGPAPATTGILLLQILG